MGSKAEMTDAVEGISRMSRFMESKYTVAVLIFLHMAFCFAQGLTSQFPWGSLNSTIGILLTLGIFCPLLFLPKKIKIFVALIPVVIWYDIGVLAGTATISTWNGEDFRTPLVDDDGAEIPFPEDIDTLYASWICIIMCVGATVTSWILGLILWLRSHELSSMFDEDILVRCTSVLGQLFQTTYIAYALIIMGDKDMFPNVSTRGNVFALCYYLMSIAQLTGYTDRFLVSKTGVFLFVAGLLMGLVFLFLPGDAVTSNLDTSNLVFVVVCLYSLACHILHTKIQVLKSAIEVTAENDTTVESSDLESYTSMAGKKQAYTVANATHNKDGRRNTIDSKLNSVL